MENNIINILKEKPLTISTFLLKNYKSLNITDSELIILIVIMSYQDKVIYNPVELANVINGDKHEVMILINNLIEKNILSLIVDKNNKKSCEYLSCDPLYEKLFNIIIDKKEEKEVDKSVFTIFEQELGRTLSPMEYEQIKEWVTSDINNDLIVLALKEAVINNVSSLRYIETILTSWRKKGYKTKEDIYKSKESYRAKKEKIDIIDMDWLNE